MLLKYDLLIITAWKLRTKFDEIDRDNHRNKIPLSCVQSELGTKYFFCI